jgi:hypothetical protein
MITSRTGQLAATSLIAFAVLVSMGCGSDDKDSGSSAEAEATQTQAALGATRETTREPTPDPTPAPDPVLVGAGDVTSCTQENDDLTAALLDEVVEKSSGEVVVFTAGDNAYEDGTIEEYESCYGPTWGRHKERTRPAPGNHEYHLAGAEGYFAYFGAAAGNPAEGWYSYNVGTWHIIVLNTSDHCQSHLCNQNSPQGLWLREVLKTNDALCTLAIWHDPLFSSGRVHGSHQHVKPFWEALYRRGADVVINGHEHNYERFAPQTPEGESDPDHGIRQFVAGTGGESHYREGEELVPNSEAADDSTYGVLKLTLRPSGYDWEFIPEPRGTFRDSGSGECHGPPPGS